MSTIDHQTVHRRNRTANDIPHLFSAGLYSSEAELRGPAEHARDLPALLGLAATDLGLAHHRDPRQAVAFGHQGGAASGPGDGADAANRGSGQH